MIKNIGNAEHYRWGDLCEAWRLLNRPELSVNLERMPPGSTEVTHHHQRARQLFFVLTGHLEMELPGNVFQLAPGDSIEVSPGDRHRARNVGGVDTTFLVISSPTTVADRINADS